MKFICLHFTMVTLTGLIYCCINSTMSEVPFRSSEGMPLSPNMLCAGFLFNAFEVTSPYERAEIYASFVPTAKKVEAYLILPKTPILP